jgi:hypothetical protein
MNNPWQEEVIELLEQCQASVYDLLLYILWSKLNKYAAQQDILHAWMHNVMDLWSEQYPSEAEEWAIEASMEACEQWSEQWQDTLQINKQRHGIEYMCGPNKYKLPQQVTPVAVAK